ncbi:MAG TPA: GNAT family N-acetyltransferase, partial [Gaiellaceae bacterium]|nr:GNAT family N-acetyltransferase [Gaiellaceae bacterium]
MPSLEIHPLSELRDEAARLLSERLARQRAAEPLLPEIADFAVHMPDEEGLVATRGAKAVAYLAGEVKREIATVGFAGHAASEPEALRDLFAVLAERWEASRFAVAVPASDEGLIDVWFRLAFGCQFIWAVQEARPAERVDFGGTIRPGTPDDLEATAEFDEILWLLQARSPSFSGLSVPSRDEFREEWRTLWEEAEFPAHFVAERDGRAVGHALMYSRPEGDLRVPSGNIDLAHAATLDDVRGTGVGLALAHHSLAWAHEHGFRSVTTDWRSVNVLSSRFWPRRGFRPQYLRLY